jgi:alkylated DNA repair dioxygenase AlkB
MIAEQLPMIYAAPQENDPQPRPDGPLWLGLSLDHRALFDALQDDWIRPPEGASGHVLGVRAFANEVVQSANGHPILVRLKFDPERLPRVPVLRRRAGEWAISSVNSDETGDPALFWPGLLPTFAITELLVASDEECARLAGLARQVSNVPLPNAPRVLRADEDVSLPQSAPPSESIAGIRLPPEMDAMRGAMAIAMWAVPRVGPWLDLLCTSLGTDPSEKLAPLASYVRSPWWASPPWIRTSSLQPSASWQERLWLSATRAFEAARTESAVMAADLVEQIAADVSRDTSEVDSIQFREWGRETIRVLRGDTKLDLGGWKASPVGKAIQLVLLRPDPSVFIKWADDLPLLPPAVWWSAAALCGLLHGYRRLPTAFRGEAEQQRLFAIHALRALRVLPAAENWVALIQGDPEWHRQSGEIVFSWAGASFARKPENSRGKWFTASLDDATAKRAAEEISRSNGWECVRTMVTVPGGDIPFSGGSVEVLPAPQQHLALKGLTRFTLPLSATFEPILDKEEFRLCIATEGANIPPPEMERRIVSSKPEEIPGLIYVPDFLDEIQEAELVAVIDKGEWSSDLRRRVQHFGWRYDYKSREIDVSMRLGSLPKWAMVLAKRLKAEGLLPHLADQVIVNEYVGSQGISRHIDLVPSFDDGVAMISLLESWEMIFREEHKGRRVPKLLARRSVAIMTGDARYHWTHEIPARDTEPGGLRRHRRISVTFRKVNDAGVVREPRRPRKRKSV